MDTKPLLLIWCLMEKVCHEILISVSWCWVGYKISFREHVTDVKRDNTRFVGGFLTVFPLFLYHFPFMPTSPSLPLQEIISIFFFIFLLYAGVACDWNVYVYIKDTKILYTCVNTSVGS